MIMFQDVSRGVDKSALADEKYIETKSRQHEIEQRFADLAKKINKVIK